MNSVKIGKLGEDKACEFLLKQNYMIIARNYTIKGGEIDIIAKDDDTLVFVEVKTRYNNKFGLPIESVDSKKQGYLKKTAERYIYENSLEDSFCRFDVVSIDYVKNECRIDLYKNAF